MILNRRMFLFSYAGLEWDVPSRPDDDGHDVNTLLFSGSLAVDAEVLLSHNLDFVVGAGYRFGGKMGNWSYREEDPDSDESKHIDAVWDGKQPDVGITGPYVTASFRFVFAPW